MSNFSDYIKNENINKHESDKDKTSKIQTKENLEEMINKYSKLDSGSLFNEFMRLTLEKKKNGTLKESELNNIKETLSPMLNDEQKEMLNSLILMVKNV